MKFSINNPCPCGSLKKYKKCCKIYHDGTLPKDALTLMKSRYSAFATNNSKYIIKTTHKSNSDFTQDTKSWKKSIESFTLATEFRKLEIIDFIDDTNESYVTFKAVIFQNGIDSSFQEKSRFLKEDNRWLYIDGEIKE
ncbi:MAG: YchJ family protein [Campylobacterota bacterium]